MASSTKIMAIPSSAFTLLRYMNKTRPSDLSPRLDDLVNDNSLDDEGPASLTSFGSSTCEDEVDPQSNEDETNRNFPRSDLQMDNKISKRYNNSYSDSSSGKGGNKITKLSRNKDGYPFLPLNPSKEYTSNSSTESPNRNRGYRKEVEANVRYPTPEHLSNNEDVKSRNIMNTAGNYPTDSSVSSDDMEAAIMNSPTPFSRGSAETPVPSSPFMTSDAGEYININIPEKSGDPAIREVLAEVVKLKQSKLLGSVASVFSKKISRTPSGPPSLENNNSDQVGDVVSDASASEAPDVVVSTRRPRDRRLASEDDDIDQDGIENDAAVVATLARLCQLYANLVEILKEENAELVAASSSSSGSSNEGSPGYTLFIHNQSENNVSPNSTPRHRPSYRGNQNQPRFMNESVLESRSLSNSFNGQQLDVPSPRRTKTDLRLTQSPKTLRIHRSPSRGRENSRTRDSMRDSPAKKGNYHEFLPGSPQLRDEAVFRDRRSNSLQPLRIRTGRKKHRNYSGKENKEEDNSMSESTQNAKIQEIEEGIKELLHLEPIDLIIKENTSNTNTIQNHDTQSSPALRRTKSLGPREHKKDFYRHKVKKSPRGQDTVDSDDDRSAREDSPCGSSCDGGNYCNYKVLAQSAHVEVDKLRQLVQLLNTRLTELSRRTVHSEARLREEMQKTVVMERFLERNALQNSNGNTSMTGGNGGGVDSRRYTHSLLAWGDPNSSTESTLRNKLDMAREEIELLRQHIDLLLRMRQEDLKVYESTVDKFRQTITTGNQW